jgi:hypothetical protein
VTIQSILDIAGALKPDRSSATTTPPRVSFRLFRRDLSLISQTPSEKAALILTNFVAPLLDAVFSSYTRPRHTSPKFCQEVVNNVRNVQKLGSFVMKSATLKGSVYVARGYMQGRLEEVRRRREMRDRSEFSLSYHYGVLFLASRFPNFVRFFLQFVVAFLTPFFCVRSPILNLFFKVSGRDLYNVKKAWPTPSSRFCQPCLPKSLAKWISML